MPRNRKIEVIREMVKTMTKIVTPDKPWFLLKLNQPARMILFKEINISDNEFTFFFIADDAALFQANDPFFQTIDNLLIVSGENDGRV